MHNELTLDIALCKAFFFQKHANNYVGMVLPKSKVCGTVLVIEVGLANSHIFNTIAPYITPV